jgi:predicted HicB family RNase H-like nuclease
MNTKQAQRVVKLDNKLKDYSLRLDPELLRKFHFIAKYEGRSVNKELIQMIKKRIESFEKEHGTIENS